MLRLSLLLCWVYYTTAGQGLTVEYDKNHDFSQYKTYRIDGGEITTPQDQRTYKEEDLHAWIKGALEEELKEKGLVKVDSAADLTLSYAIGSTSRTDYERLGPMGTSPGNSNQVWSRDYQLSSVMIDMNDRKGNLVWRVNGTTNVAPVNVKRGMDQVVAEGFKKFSIKPKKKKKR